MGHLLDDKRATLTAWLGGRIGAIAVTERYECSADIALRHTPGFEQRLAFFRNERFLGAADDAASKPQSMRLERHVLRDGKGIGNAKQKTLLAEDTKRGRRIVKAIFNRRAVDDGVLQPAAM